MMFRYLTVIDISQDIHSMTAFKRNTSGLIRRMKKNHRPLVLTVKGKAEAVVMEPAVYQKIADYHDAVEGIRRGLQQAQKGLGRSVDEVFDAIEKEAADRTA
jgi:PHD/YefM family antitoxin component YafN of YafNO toxin-antitoxin module